jgi:hypothetical protein
VGIGVCGTDGESLLIVVQESDTIVMRVKQSIKIIEILFIAYPLV